MASTYQKIAMDQQVSVEHVPRVRTRIGVRVDVVAEKKHVLANLPLAISGDHVRVIDVRSRHRREAGAP